MERVIAVISRKNDVCRRKKESGKNKELTGYESNELMQAAKILKNS